MDNEELERLRILTTSKMKPISIDPSAYPKWLEQHKASSAMLEKQSMVTFKKMPLFSIVVPLFNTPDNLFREMVESVLKQSYANWELVLVNASPDNSALVDMIETAKNNDARIKVIELASNSGISKILLPEQKKRMEISFASWTTTILLSPRRFMNMRMQLMLKTILILFTATKTNCLPMAAMVTHSLSQI